MIQGCRKLSPILEKYRELLGDIILECGPYHNPAVQPTEYPEKQLVYLDIDPVAIQSLRRSFANRANALPIRCKPDQRGTCGSGRYRE